MNKITATADLDTLLPDSRPAVRAALADYVRRLTTEHASEIISITLYGSQARGDADDESDIDVFIVVRHRSPVLDQALGDLAWKVEFEHNVVISDIIRSVDQLRAMQSQQWPYYQNIKEEGIILWTSTSAPMHVFA